MSPPKEPKPVDPGVLGGLSRTRPQRRSTRRSPREGAEGVEPRGAGLEASAEGGASTSDAPVADAVKAARKAAKNDSAGKKAKSGKSTSKAKAKAAAKAEGAGAGTTGPKASGKAKPAEKPKPKAKTAKPAPPAARPGKAPVAEAAPVAPRANATPPADDLPPAGYATPERDGSPSGNELVATAIQAAGEVGRLGQAAVRGLLSRLPKP